MDFSTIQSIPPLQLAAMLQPTLTTVASFTADHIMTASHTGNRFKPLSRTHAKQHARHRHSTGMHTHVWYEMCIPLQGQCMIETRQGVFPMEVSTLSIFPPGMHHCEHRQSSQSHHALLWVCFGHAYTLVMPSIHTTEGRWATPLRWNITGRLATQVTAAVPLTQTMQPGDIEHFRAALLSTLAEVYRQALTTPAPATSRNRIDPHHVLMLEQLEKFIVQHLHQPIRLQQLASIAHLSPNHLNALFRKWSGLPVHRWIIHKRMEKAMTLLKQPGSLAKQVALAVGYDDPLYFSRAFHRYHGQWPSDIKNNTTSTRT